LQLIEKAAAPNASGWHLPDGDADIRRVYDLQRSALRSKPNPTAAQRRARLRALRHAVDARSEGVRAALRADFGKPGHETDFTELHPTITELLHAIKHLGGWMKPERVPTPLLLFSATSEIRREPKGHVLVLAPWNYPFYLSMVPVIAAVAAGNRVVLRPSEKAPHTAVVIGEIVAAAFPEDEVATVGGGVEVAESLLALEFDHIFFTGSTRVGKRVMRAAAEHLSGVTLELGGKSPAIVDAHCDLDAAADRIAWGKLINAGQTCVAPDYVLAHESVVDAFVERTVRAVQRFYGESEDDRARSESYCRLIDQGAFDRVTGALDATVTAGARIVIGGGRDRATRYLAPTVLTGVTAGAPIMDEEIFGPVLPVLTYRTLDEALALINGRPKPLALYVFSTDRQTVETVLARTSAGGSVVNNTVIHLANPDLPFGGIGPSGVGNYHGRHGFRAFSHERAVLIQHRISLGSLVYPPYGKRSNVVLRAIERFMLR
jgi:aldehyde dehydrogenase (NAD+)